MKTIICVIFLFFVFVPFSNAQERDLISHNELFGNPPDSIPVVFSRGIISIGDRYEYGLAISPDYHEIFFTAATSIGSRLNKDLIVPLSPFSFLYDLKIFESPLTSITV